jgi:hypothetical protein
MSETCIKAGSWMLTLRESEVCPDGDEPSPRCGAPIAEIRAEGNLRRVTLPNGSDPRHPRNPATGRLNLPSFRVDFLFKTVCANRRPDL